MKNLKKVLALVLAVVMIMSVVTVASAKTYTDVKATDNYADAIDALSSLKILDGFKDGDNYSFKAEDPFTRAQAAKIVAIVHNAATNGKIQDQDAISALYSNAQNNKFVDCNNSWALPFINYCRITGLADGMTATTYEPNRYVTGVQFLKLMLTTLNFDTAKEGYTGTGWDVNVLNRANEIGLTAGLADGWKAIAPITRGEAAQVLYNALTKYLVEYGQLIKGFNPTTAAVYNAAFVSNEQVAKSGFTLGAKMGISIKRATDAFRRPGYNWSYGSWAAFYMDKPVNSYTKAVSACEILKNDMKVSETSGKSVKLNGHVKGEVKAGESGWENTYATELKVDGKATKGTALNYFAVDGRKYAYGAEDYAGITLSHDQDKNCQKVTGGWWNAQFGGQGDLTQVFKTEDGWV
ncbi:MAG: S-layer homology domain-containing protein, partial [Oscillospiraceae bacterium]|nr:S-layer homology domain-containing protein [Oscillospiraceae bacterium]